jgi:hypothetical protein
MKMSDTKLPEAIDMQLIEGGPLKPEDHPVQIWLDEEWTVWNHSGENDQGEENVSYIRADLALACVEALREWRDAKIALADDPMYITGADLRVHNAEAGLTATLAALEKSFPQPEPAGATKEAK